jgi:hypothetical protein
MEGTALPLDFSGSVSLGVSTPAYPQTLTAISAGESFFSSKRLNSFLHN